MVCAPATRAMPEPSRSSLDDLLERCILALEAGDEAAVEGVLTAHPDQAAELRQRLANLKSLGILDAPGSVAQIPERLGEFRLLRQIGRGGMGIVYLAEQTALQRQVALKLVHPEQLFFPGARERFRREVLAVARLQHPGIVPILTGGEADGIPFYAMEMVHGASLQELLHELVGGSPAALDGQALRSALHRAMAKKHDLGPVADAAVFTGAWVSVCCRLALQAAVALQHAHDQGVLHRDVKPSNLLLTSDGRVRLIDFGLASARGEQRITRTGSAFGSLPYMSPEQVRGELDAIDARTDVYSLGVTLYELLTLTLPHGDGSGTTRERILAGAIEPPTRRNAQVHQDLEAICMLAMDLDRSRRYATAGAFADDLRNFLEQRSVWARRPSPWLRARRWAIRHPARATAIASLFLVCVPAPLVFAAQQASARREVQAQRDAAEEQRREAEHQRTIARAEKETADAQRQEAERQSGIAEREQERAEANLNHAIAAVDQMLFRTAQARLMDVPRTRQLRRNLLEDAIGLYERLLASADGEGLGDSVRLQRARTLVRVGILKADVGELEAAAAQLNAGVQALRALREGGSATLAVRRELAHALRHLSDTLGRMDQLEPQEQAQAQSIVELEAAVTAHPEAHELPPTLAEARLVHAAVMSRLRRFVDAHGTIDAVEATLAAEPSRDTVAANATAWARVRILAANQRGITCSLAGDTTRAMAAFEAALARIDERPATEKDTSEIVMLRLDVLESLGAMANQRREWDRAATWLDQCTELLERLHAEEPEVPSRAARLADNLGTRALNRHQLGDSKGARQDHDRAVALLDEVVRTVGAETHHRRRIAAALGKRAGSLVLNGDLEAALRDIDRSEDVLEALVQENPADEVSKANLAATLGNHASTLAQAGRVPEARGVIERAIAIARERSGGEGERSVVELCGTAADLAMRDGDTESGERWMAEAHERVTAWLAKQPQDSLRQATAAMIGANRGTMFLQLRKHDEARSCWEAALPHARTAAPKTAFARQVLAILLLRLADVATRDGDIPTARTWFAAALRETGARKEQFARFAPLAALFDRPDLQDLLQQHTTGR